MDFVYVFDMYSRNYLSYWRYATFSFMIVCSLFLFACGGKPDAVTIDDGSPIDSIKSDTIDNWYRSSLSAVAPSCEAQIKDAGKTEADKEACIKQLTISAKQQVLDGLIGDSWSINEAASLGIDLSASEKSSLNKKIAKLPSQGLSTKSRYQRGEAEILLAKMIAREAKKSKLTVSRVRGKQAYLKNKDQFSAPELRDAVFIVAPDKRTANEIVSRLKKGDSPETILSDLGAPDSQAAKSVLRNLTLKTVPQGAKFLFSSSKGEVLGPRKFNKEWIVAKVIKIKPAENLSFDQAWPRMKKEARTQYARRAVLARIDNKWRPKTSCADGWSSPFCRNRPRTSNKGGSAGQ